ncbi:MAG: HdeD family acid-resistance protein [Methylobacteriaceae bacterium]|nr:HdeD family acid-resistance protein [Methylobacteriaceae bacterium]
MAVTQAADDPTLVAPPPAAPRSLGDALDRAAARWGWFIAFGAVLVLLGVVASISLVTATIASVLVNGMLMIVAGVGEIVVGARAREWSRFVLWSLAGLFYIAAGVIAILNPLLAAAVFTLMLGAGLIAAGLVRAWLAWKMPAAAPRGWPMLAAVLTILLGVFVIALWPVNSLFLLGALLAVDLIVQGVGWISFGLALRRRRD